VESKTGAWPDILVPEPANQNARDSSRAFSSSLSLTANGYRTATALTNMLVQGLGDRVFRLIAN
jgi:hypothetical protein